MTPADKRFEHGSVSQLEAEIARYETFLKLPEMFTYLGMDGGDFTVPRYFLMDDEGELDVPCLVSHRGTKLPTAHQAELPVHFVDNTGRRIMEYIPRMDITTMIITRGYFGRRTEHITTEQHQLVLKKNLAPKDANDNHESGTYWTKESEMHWTDDKQYSPRIIVFPTNGHFYMEKTENNPIDDIRKFKEFIRGKAQDQRRSAQSSIDSYHQASRDTAAKSEQEERVRLELMRNKGMKI